MKKGGKGGCKDPLKDMILNGSKKGGKKK